MAEQVIFGKTFKRINSISKVYEPIVTTEVTIKEPCSITAPVFLVKQDYRTMRECNYAEYAGFYYYIDNIVSIRNKHVLVQCHRDPLASFADDIKSHVIFAAYADADNYDNRLDDTRMTTDLTQEGSVSSSTIQFTGGNSGEVPIFDNEGTVILSTYVTTTGYVQWAITLETFAELIGEIYQSVWQETQSGNLDEAFKKFAIKYFGGTTLQQAILSAIWVPYSLELYKGEYANIIIGTYEVQGVQGLALSNVLNVETATPHSVVLPGSADGPLKDYPWLRHPAYTSVQFLHPNGVADISCPEMVKNPVYQLNLAVNKTTGDYVVNVSCTPDQDREFTVSTISGNLSIDLTHWLTTQGVDGGDIGMAMGKWGIGSISMMAGAIGGHPSVIHTDYSTNDGKVTPDGGYSVHYQGNGSTTETSYNKVSHKVSSIASGIHGMLPGARPHVSYGGSACSPNILLAYRDGDTNLNDAFRINVESAFPRIIVENQYDDFCLLNGYPCKKNVALSAIETGYVQGCNASIGAYGATQMEIATINSMVNSGIYFEE